MESQLLWFAAAGGLGVGLVLGYLLSRGFGRRDARRVRELEDEITSARSEHTRYRTQVADHFVETSRRLQDLTLQYQSVYEHLADGARTLCPDGDVAIAASLAEAALPERAGSDRDDDAQLDLALDATPGSWTPAQQSDLDPILDDESPPPPPIDRAS